MEERATSQEPTSPEEESFEETFRWFRDLVDRTNSGDDTALSQLREGLEQCPILISALCGNMAIVATDSLIDAITGERLSQKEAILKQLETMRAELAGPTPSPIEKLLVDRVVVCWLQTQHADNQFANARTVSIEIGDFMQRRQDRAHRRYLSAITTLARVRRLALPIRVDVNVAASVETKSAEPTQSVPPSWERVPSAN